VYSHGYIESAMASHSYGVKALQIMKSVMKRSLQPDAPLADVPAGTLKVPLRGHQQAVLAAMEQYEQGFLKGCEIKGETVYSTYGILGDSVGVGKSLMVLGHIARLRTLPPLGGFMEMTKNSSGSFFSVKRTEYQVDASEANALIIVPHTLFRQWADYIRNQTNLKALYLDKIKVMAEEGALLQKVREADVVLISNTLYKAFSHFQRNQGLRWRRVFIDEADTIHLVNGYPWPQARFTWFITASWMNLLFPNETLYVSTQMLQQYVFGPGAKYSMLAPFFKDVIRPGHPYAYMRHSMTSYNYMREILNNSHPMRGAMVIRCTEEFVSQSITLPQLTRLNLLCKAPLAQQIVSEVLPTNIQELLHGGDVQGAISALGVKVEDTGSLIEAVTENLRKELKRHQATLQFKSSLEYSSPQAKDTALKSLEEKIAKTQASIKSVEERIAGFKEELCPICYDEPQSALMTPCCQRVFCAQCILTCLTRAPSCPMCRNALSAKGLTKVITEEEKNAIVASSKADAAAQQPKEELERKSDALFRILKENPAGRFLVFSRYDNPFVAMEQNIEALGIRVRQLKGNKDAVAATLRAFQGGETRCLLLNSHYAGSGLNITAATHVILLHAMTHEEEKQILGRAYRMGRTEPLSFIRLLHADEMPASN
jgi:SNF2 family DNA or RNA helicase